MPNTVHFLRSAPLTRRLRGAALVISTAANLVVSAAVLVVVSAAALVIVSTGAFAEAPRLAPGRIAFSASTPVADASGTSAPATPASAPTPPSSRPTPPASRPTAAAPSATATKPGAPAGYKHLGGMTTITRGDVQVDAYLVIPKGPVPHSAVIVIQEWWGLNDQIKSVADGLARKGYVALAPDLYHGKVTADPAVAMELLKALSTDRALNELSASFAHLRSIPAAAGRPIGSIGFCMGGGLSLRLAIREPELRAAVVCYGRPETDSAKLQPMNAPVLGIYGGKDDGIPSSLVEEFRKAMQSAGKSVTIKTYPASGHGFMNPSNPSHRPADTQDAWSRIDDFFAEHLKPPVARLHGDATQGQEPGKGLRAARIDGEND